MSSEGCSLDPLLTGNFVQHLQDRLLSLPPELVAVTASSNGGSGAGASDLESDDSVYYDVDSPGSTCSNTSSPSETPFVVLDKQPTLTPTPDSTSEFFDVSTEKETELVQRVALLEKKGGENNCIMKERNGIRGDSNGVREVANCKKEESYGIREVRNDIKEDFNGLGKNNGIRDDEPIEETSDDINETNSIKEESRFRVTTVIVGHKLLNGNAPRDVSSEFDLEDEEEHISIGCVPQILPEVPPCVPQPAPELSMPRADSCLADAAVTSPAEESASQICEDVSKITLEAQLLPSVVVDNDEDYGEMILLDGECYEDRTSSPAEEQLDRLQSDERGDRANGGGSVEKEDDVEDILNVKKHELKRSSSLKASKIIEGISREKKIVRFADALGLDLADVRTFLELEPPKIPKSAFSDLEGAEYSGSPLSSSPNTTGAQQTQPLPTEKTVVPLFRQPIREMDFMERLNRNKVCLECANVTDVNLFTITGTIRVINLDFHKSVWVRYTKDNWKSFIDLSAKYVENSCDGFSDKFRFVLFAHTLTVGDRLEFAVKYQVKTGQYWDNNRNANYAFQCVPEVAAPVRPPPTTVLSAYLPSSPSLDSWGSFY